jgi:hypothetical protein
MHTPLPDHASLGTGHSRRATPVDNDVSLDFADDHGPVHPQHYAFLVSDSDFDQIRSHPAAVRVSRCATTDWMICADPGVPDR